MKYVLPIAVLCVAASPAVAGCPLDKIAAALDAPLAAMKPLEREVSDIQSTEGGLWRIYREKDGRVHTLARLDYGESGRSELRLSVVNRKTYGIAKTRIDYLHHAFSEDGPNADVRKTTEIYFFCDGKVYLPNRDSAMIDMDQYPKDAAAARKAMLDDKDVADFTKGLAR